jgi:hypothetical protein
MFQFLIILRLTSPMQSNSMHKKCNLLCQCVLSKLHVVLNGEACEIYAIRVSEKYIFTTTVKHHKFPQQMVHTRFLVVTVWLMKVWDCDIVTVGKKLK